MAATSSTWTLPGVSSDNHAALFRFVRLVVNMPAWMRSMVLDPTQHGHVAPYLMAKHSHEFLFVRLMSQQNAVLL